MKRNFLRKRIGTLTSNGIGSGRKLSVTALLIFSTSSLSLSQAQATSSSELAAPSLNPLTSMAVEKMASPSPLMTTQALDPLVDLPTWLATEASIAEATMFKNISPAAAVRGVVLASPSKADPNYYYYWIRDGALVMRSVLGLFEDVDPADTVNRQKYKQAMLDYVQFSHENQLTTGTGAMGEPRFNVADGTINTEPWGRPQNDGPALRALTLIRFGEDLLKDGEKDYVEKNLYNPHFPADTVIKSDLEYVGHHWQDSCVDLWEEIWGHHFFTQAVQLISLREGAKFAASMGDSGAAGFYSAQADLLEVEVLKHWDDKQGYYLETLDLRVAENHPKPSNLDTAVVLAALAVDQDSGPLSLFDDRILQTATKLDRAFAGIYGINTNTQVGTAIGRYTEDYYYGGNPWVLTTAAFGELNYRLAQRLHKAATFVLTAEQAVYLNDVVAKKMGAKLVGGLPVQLSLREGSDIAANPALKVEVETALRAKGDDYLNRIRLHTNPDGGLAEQISRTNGLMISARDLSWSYASFLRALAARNHQD